jgi:regulator of protease activity HflC (stomatin/prohibitin superfamily)
MKISNIITALVVTLFVGWIAARMLLLTVIPPGNVGIVSQFGSIDPVPLSPGLHILSPVKSVETVSIRPLVHVSQASAATSKLQSVTTDIAVTYWLNPKFIPQIRSKIGGVAALNAVLLNNNIPQSLKEVTGDYTAEDLMQKRDEVKGKVEDALRRSIDAALKEKDLEGALVISKVAITDFAFSQSFNDSINQKVQQEQLAQQAVNDRDTKNILTKADSDAKKKIVDANAYKVEVISKANAQAIKLKAEALKANPGVVDLRLAQKWDGEEPEYFSCGKLPFIGIELGGACNH